MKIATAQYDADGYLAAPPQWRLPSTIGFGDHDPIPTTMDPGFWHRTRVIADDPLQAWKLFELLKATIEGANGTLITLDVKPIVVNGGPRRPFKKVQLIDIRYLIEEAHVTVPLREYVFNDELDRYMAPDFELKPDPVFCIDYEDREAYYDDLFDQMRTPRIYRFDEGVVEEDIYQARLRGRRPLSIIDGHRLAEQIEYEAVEAPYN